MKERERENTAKAALFPLEDFVRRAAADEVALESVISVQAHAYQSNTSIFVSGSLQASLYPSPTAC
jgi:hypothetical protein